MHLQELIGTIVILELKGLMALKEAWFQEAEAFVRAFQGETSLQQLRNPVATHKFQRIAGQQWLLALDHSLTLLKGDGQKRWMLMEPSPLRDLSIEGLSMRPDPIHCRHEALVLPVRDK